MRYFFPKKKKVQKLVKGQETAVRSRAKHTVQIHLDYLECTLIAGQEIHCPVEVHPRH